MTHYSSPSDDALYGQARMELGGLVKRNPFYLLSAACMLTGCLLLTNTTTWSPIALQRLLTLLTTVNVYEIALLALALFLVRRGIIGDARVLLILQAVFLVDVTFLNAEVVNSNYTVGVGINIGLFLLSLGKLWAIRGALNIPVSAAQVIQCVLQMACLFALPAVVNKLSQTPRQFYVLWWVIGLLPAIYEVLMRVFRHEVQGRWVDGRQRTVSASLYLTLSWLSLVLHLSILHYVYGTQWTSPMLAPILLGLALVTRRAVPDRVASRPHLRFFGIALPLAAVVISRGNQEELSFVFAGLKLSPLAMTIGAAYLLYVYWFFARHALWFILGGCGAAGWYVFGPTFSQIRRGIGRTISLLLDLVDRLIPDTVAGWGAIGLVAAFVFLGIGGMISLRRAPAPGALPHEPTGPPPA